LENWFATFLALFIFRSINTRNDCHMRNKTLIKGKYFSYLKKSLGWEGHGSNQQPQSPGLAGQCKMPSYLHIFA